MIFLECVLLVSLQFGLNAMMALRVYAMYGRSKKFRALLLACFSMAQTVGIASAICSVIKPDLSSSSTIGCTWRPSKASVALKFGNNISLCAYDTIMFVLALGIVFRNRTRGFYGSVFSYDNLLAILLRDNVLYFLIASVCWALSACSYVPRLSAESFVHYGSIALTNYVNIILGPTMMLSIRRVDAKRTQGGTYNTTEEDTMVFATVGYRSQFHKQVYSL